MASTPGQANLKAVRSEVSDSIEAVEYSEFKATPKTWLFARVVGEPGFWMRTPLAHEIIGLDPLTGMLIAHSEKERDEIDARSDARANAALARAAASVAHGTENGEPQESKP
jgi:hypothetical protein